MTNLVENIQKKARTLNGENPLATNLNDLIDQKRLDAIFAISNRLRLDPNQISEQRFGFGVDELSNAGAEEILEILNMLYNHSSKQRNL